MSKKEKSLSALVIDSRLAFIRKRCLSDGALTDGFGPSHRLFDPKKADQKFGQDRERYIQRADAELRKQINKQSQLRQATQKFDQDRERFIQRADADQRKQINKLWQFHRAAKYGPALSTSWKRTRRAMLFNALQNLPKSTKVLTAILKAAQKDDEFWNDFAIAAKLKKTRSPVNWFLAEYSWLMLGRRPALTFGELHKILHWINPADLRKKIRDVRKRYGEFAVPLKRGRPGRPSKK
jgi:hypothetical protein